MSSKLDDDTASDYQTYDKIVEDRSVASQSPAEATGTHSTPTRDPRETMSNLRTPVPISRSQVVIHGSVTFSV
jgi:hypothetical protein